MCDCQEFAFALETDENRVYVLLGYKAASFESRNPTSIGDVASSSARFEMSKRNILSLKDEQFVSSQHRVTFTNDVHLLLESVFVF